MSKPLSYWRERVKSLESREYDDPTMGAWSEYLGYEMQIDDLESKLAEAQGKLDAVVALASEAVCPGCMQKMDEACVDDGCNWGRQFFAILGIGVEPKNE